MQFFSQIKEKKIKPEQLFMLSVLAVNGGNYLYNLILGRILGPAQFADAAVLITFLLVLSFAAMTFQLVTAKFSVLFENDIFQSFISKVYKNALAVGLAFGALIIIFAGALQNVFNTSSSNMFVVFGFGVPLYFLMSVNRGVFQGKKSFKNLSITYQTEMLSRLVITLGLILLFDIKSSVVIAVGILASFVFGLFPFKYKNLFPKKALVLSQTHSKDIRHFFIITAFYELTQIIINNSDILLVKHFFESYEAGLYASLALIGRIVYFIAWMFVMLLLPTVVELKKEGKKTAPILFKYVGYIAAISITIILVCLAFPETIITLLFGDSYIAMAPLLWKYAIATSMFAISNIFAYYYLSLDKYVPVVISGVFGMLQMLLVIYFHDSLEQVVYMQIVAMLLLLVIQLIYFKYDSSKSAKTLNLK
ncbi:oligosaccharide flippase family protein [Algibacter lectus]|uniref:O-antigen/teichoic acid export membrane protein n=1 Tax=Algibacter lectus TaxID=221126 RepID=A0A4R8MG80_9FLAO|nr:oligosaccharide flippase family protein [Algibacter lectus]MDO7136595.1 oligosaccharide flippase family protein [Algibacter lectus]MWW23809.1 oligosaccharide flippase family protein [Algibacter lectus]TDY63507.1 O-antigen/teichoic acid export membrane protein [Algibacter lectus]SFC44143.1 Membrane protein involved in the export of O-antigen and teichoic acid [Algibacter lectus]